MRVVGVDDDYNVFYRASPTALSAVLPGVLIYGLVESAEQWNPLNLLITQIKRFCRRDGTIRKKI